MKNLAVVLLSLLAWLSLPAQAEKFVEDEQYVVHYNAFNSTMLKPDVAKANNLLRSRQRAIMNIAVLKKMSSGPQKAVMAQVSGFASALGGSERRLDFRMVTEGDAIYYLAEFLIGDGETLNFNLTIKPTPEHPPIKVTFSQEFFQD